MREKIRESEPGALFELPPTDEQDAHIEGETENILRIPFRGLAPGTLTSDDITLRAGDVVVVPSRTHEVFYVVGKLNVTGLIRFSSGLEVRDLGVERPRER